jgi:type II secretory pathway component GspD/PulD (secretin)
LFLGDASKVASAETIYPAVNQVVNGNQIEDFFDGLPGLKDVVSLPKNFVAQINALEREKILKVRSRPQIATLNGQTASLTIGQTQYFLLKSETDFNQNQSSTSRSTERFEKIEADVKLTVTPYVTGDGEVTCEILPDFSEPSGSFDANIPPTINRRSFKSTVRLRENETIILGGMIKETENDVHTQLPFLGSIPYLGWLFKNVTHVTTRSQLMIFVTPHIYYGSDANVDVTKYLETLQ